MPEITQKITHELDRLCQITSSDFASLSLAEPNEQRIRWLYAYGNRNERYKRMIVKAGAGPDGLALRTGKAVMWDEQADLNRRTMSDCPLLTAEQLRSAAVIPLYEGSAVIGLLLAARRAHVAYTNQELLLICEQLPRIAVILKHSS